MLGACLAAGGYSCKRTRCIVKHYWYWEYNALEIQTIYGCNIWSNPRWKATCEKQHLQKNRGEGELFMYESMCGHTTICRCLTRPHPQNVCVFCWYAEHTPCADFPAILQIHAGATETATAGTDQPIRYLLAGSLQHQEHPRCTQHGKQVKNKLSVTMQVRCHPEI